VLQYPGDPFQFHISNGAAINTVTFTRTVAPATATWYFVAGRYDPSAEIKVYVGNNGPLESATVTSSCRSVPYPAGGSRVSGWPGAPGEGAREQLPVTTQTRAGHGLHVTGRKAPADGRPRLMGLPPPRE